jgi:predicted dehydrogenase
MYKIAILGCENSHATSFLSLIAEGLYPDISVIGIYSDEAEPMEKLRERFGVPVMESYDALVGQVDGIMITARHGDNHYKYAKPYIAKGIPMFIDKPITCREEDALLFMRDAMERNVRLCGGSTMALRPETLELAQIVADQSLGDLAGGSIVCPYYPTSPYGGFYFYAQHLVDIMMAVFGTNIRRVRAQENSKGMMLSFDYDTFIVQGAYIASGTYYNVSIYGKKGFKTQEITFDAKSFCSEMDEMLHLLNGGQMAKSYAEFILPVYVMNAIERSVSNAAWEEIPEIRI